jgi:hypothetical protein
VALEDLDGGHGVVAVFGVTDLRQRLTGCRLGRLGQGV